MLRQPRRVGDTADADREVVALAHQVGEAFIEMMPGRVTTIVMGAEIDTTNEFEPLADCVEDVPSAEGNAADGVSSAARWSAVGTHTGAGVFGEPGGCEVQTWGLANTYWAVDAM